MNWNDVYPRPGMVRKSWQSLCGEWTVNGEAAYVPSCRTEEELWYKKSFDFKRENDVAILHFEAVDQIAEVMLNGRDLGRHAGGYLPFAFDISDIVTDGENTLEVHVIDSLSHELPYGKQKKDHGGMWYTPMSGIWQSVWIEQVPCDYIRNVRIDPDLIGAEITVECPVRPKISFMDRVYEPELISIHATENDDKKSDSEPGGTAQKEYDSWRFRVDPQDPHLWTPDDPYLYHAAVITEKDEVSIYFALRNIEIRDTEGIKRVCLNGEPIFLHGVLDQGYFEPGLMLPPDPEEYSRDILRMKELGFNLLRKHIKIEPSIFYYECDRLGMLVMQDMVNSGDYSFLKDTVLPTIGIGRNDMVNEYDNRMNYFVNHSLETLRLLHNHPCIIAWTIFNEGWGQFDSDSLYAKFKEWDPSRLVDSTSGWFAQKRSDFDSRHIYFRTPKLNKGGKDGRPLFISECGGYSLDLRSGGGKTYGYGKCRDSAELTAKIEQLYEKMVIPAISLGCCGCVYTQLSDIEEEINGLYSYHRRTCKVEKKALQQIAQRLAAELGSCVNRQGINHK